MIACEEFSAPGQPPQSPPSDLRLFRRFQEPPGVNPAELPDTDAKPAPRIRGILVPTDFSACSLAAVAQAAALARHHDATLTLLHVIDSNSPAALTHVGSAANLMRQLWLNGSSRLCPLAESLAQAQTKTETRIIEGLPAEAIIEYSSGFDLLVIGERDSKPAWHFFSRQTARRVIEEALCPVLVVHERPGRMVRELESETRLAA